MVGIGLALNEPSPWPYLGLIGMPLALKPTLNPVYLGNVGINGTEGRCQVTCPVCLLRQRRGHEVSGSSSFASLQLQRVPESRTRVLLTAA